jgi:hypothetical protein
MEDWKAILDRRSQHLGSILETKEVEVDEIKQI